MLSDWIKDYFYHTAIERKGTAVLGFLVIFFAFLPKIYPFLITDQNKIDVMKLQAEASLHQSILPENTAHEDLEKEMNTYHPFPFNPNTATSEEFSQLGLSEKVINTITHYREKGGRFYKPEDFKKIWGLKESDFFRLKDYITIENNRYEKNDFSKNKYEKPEEIVVEYNNFDPNVATIDDFLKLGIPKKTAFMITRYREKGGKFKKKEDLKKIYGMPEDIYAKVEPYIVFASQPQQQNTAFANTQNTPTNIPSNTPTAYNNNNFPSKTFTPKPIVSIDINKSTEEDWVKLPGIGQGYAKRIVNFRTKLGGFYTIEQVKETFGLPDSTFQKIKTQLISSPILKKININSATAEELKAHPYLKWQQVNILVNYRTQHGGKIANFDELKKIQGLTPDIIEKIKPYLEF